MGGSKLPLIPIRTSLQHAGGSLLCCHYLEYGGLRVVAGGLTEVYLCAEHPRSPHFRSQRGPMPTATLITRGGSFVAFLGNSRHKQEINKDTSITIISPQSKQLYQQRQSESKKKSITKKSQPEIKPTIQTKKKTKNIKLSTAMTRKLCSYEVKS